VSSLEIGAFTAQGLAQGLDQSAGVVTTAAAGLGDEAISALKGTMSQISSAVSDNIDINPTIRPVLDLTDIQAGAGTIGGMFGNTGIGVNGTYWASRLCVERIFGQPGCLSILRQKCSGAYCVHSEQLLAEGVVCV
jgi:hypothetical protein